MEKYKVGNSGAEIKINQNWMVLDIASGHNPHPRANLLADKYLEDNTERSGASVKIDKKRPFIICDVHYLPFKNKVFDYVIASHIAEHVECPDKFCNELMRVSKRGYIETPSKIGEMILTEPYHKWYVSTKGSGVVFEKKKNYKPLSEIFYRIFYFDINRAGYTTLTFSNKYKYIIFKVLAVICRRLWIVSMNMTYTCFEWIDTFNFKIKD